MSDTRADTHACPGGCGQQVPRKLLACRLCWYRLPGHIRNAVLEGYNDRRHDQGRAHRQALLSATIWYRNNQGS